MSVIVVKVGEPIMSIYSVTNIAFSEGAYVLTTSSGTFSYSADEYHIVIT